MGDNFKWQKVESRITMTDSVSIKISSDAKMFLDSIQQQLHSSGLKISEKKILDLIIENSDAAVIKKLLKVKDNEALNILKKPLHWNVEDSSEDIDRYLY